jgi:osmoprotectant transport system substrate-binding protein
LRVIVIVMLLLALAGCGPSRRQYIVIGSKNFTEQLVLGELFAQFLHAKTGLPVERRFYLAGTYICQQAILAGRIDIYPEYTGTALTTILKQKAGGTPQQIYERVKRAYARRFHLDVGPPLGFNDSFAIVVRGEDAKRLNLHTISQAAAYTPHWRAGFGYEFMERPDGYQGLVKTYGLRFAGPPRIMDLGLLYRALESHQVDLVAGNTTDGQIEALHFTILKDDRHYFPPYQAVPIVRMAAEKLHPQIRTALDELAGRISAEEMRKMNYAVDGEHRDVRVVVGEFLKSKGL